jgi:hypothetical protein
MLTVSGAAGFSENAERFDSQRMIHLALMLDFFNPIKCRQA